MSTIQFESFEKTTSRSPEEISGLFQKSQFGVAFVLFSL
jgi:hypothetical protein